MDKSFLEISQYINKHPLHSEKEEFKEKYVKALKSISQKYSQNDQWALSALQLYSQFLINKEINNISADPDIKNAIKAAAKTKLSFKPFRFYTYRFCFVFDCILINAYDDYAKGNQIIEEIMSYYNKKNAKTAKQVFDFLYYSSMTIPESKELKYMADCWKKNSSFASRPINMITVTANMSAGKSTLLNAIVGKKVCKTQNDACTAKIHYIINKPFDDGLYYELDNALNLNADHQTLMDDDPDNLIDEIAVGAYFKCYGSTPGRVWLIDTPGVNSYQNENHKKITTDTLEKIQSDTMLYVMNCSNIGTNDDLQHLSYICDTFKGRIVFVINKLDTFRKEDSVSATIQAAKEDLIKIGFNEPLVVPISAYAAFLAKQQLNGEPLDEDELDEFDALARKLNKEEYQFDRYYQSNIRMDPAFEDDKAYKLLFHSGIIQLENIIFDKENKL